MESHVGSNFKRCGLIELKAQSVNPDNDILLCWFVGTVLTSNSYTMGCPPVRGDNP